MKFGRRTKQGGNASQVDIAVVEARNEGKLWRLVAHDLERERDEARRERDELAHLLSGIRDYLTTSEVVFPLPDGSVIRQRLTDVTEMREADLATHLAHLLGQADRADP